MSRWSPLLLLLLGGSVGDEAGIDVVIEATAADVYYALPYALFALRRAAAASSESKADRVETLEQYVAYLAKRGGRDPFSRVPGGVGRLFRARGGREPRRSGGLSRGPSRPGPRRRAGEEPPRLFAFRGDAKDPAAVADWLARSW
ncbi:hypothetical protein JL721_5384 [Aureococcus anophagefferens]|nr:hypothetical protein JL721_5384 [Aureococcus anophagefferens]